jgi:hypothetical protein
MSNRDFKHPDSLKIASEQAGIYLSHLVAAGYKTRILGRPQPGEFIIETVETGFRVVVNPLPGNTAVLAA